MASNRRRLVIDSIATFTATVSTTVANYPSEEIYIIPQEVAAPKDSIESGIEVWISQWRRHISFGKM
jgi:hypothetical protein